MDSMASIERISPGDFSWLQAWLLERSGIILEDARKFLAEKRMQPLPAVKGLPDLKTLFGILRADPQGDLAEDVLEALTKSETWFFRDMPVFEQLRRQILPERLAAAQAAGRPIRIWSAACSTGQEAYSLAIHLAEELGEGWERKVELVASDLSQRQVAHAKDGAYDREAVNRGLPAALLTKHFIQLGSRWHINEDLRAAVDFKTVRLDHPWKGLPLFDVILLRNVLPYFDEATRLDVLWRVRKQLLPGGSLILGAAERNELNGAYDQVDAGRNWYYRRAELSVTPSLLSLGYGSQAA